MGGGDGFRTTTGSVSHHLIEVDKCLTLRPTTPVPGCKANFGQGFGGGPSDQLSSSEVASTYRAP